jgi:hypothetical protein
MFLWFAYHHAWHIVRRDEKRSPLDPEGRWYQPGAVNTAVEFYRKKFGIAAPKPHRQSTPEEIAHTERRTKMAIANLEERGRAVFRDPVRQVREAMGVTATERKLHPYEDDDAVRRAAKELGL